MIVLKCVGLYRYIATVPDNHDDVKPLLVIIKLNVSNLNIIRHRYDASHSFYAIQSNIIVI